MLTDLHSKKGIQLLLGLVIGILFGFLLQKGGLTRYDIIEGQLLLIDYTVLKVMLSAIITGMVGVYLLRSLGLAQLHPKPGSLGSAVIGGLLFGIGFGTLGYCPGTIAGAAGNGALDAVIGGVVGVLVGAGVFSEVYPRLQRGILQKGDMGTITLPELLKIHHWVVIVLVVAVLGMVLWVLESLGL